MFFCKIIGLYPEASVRVLYIPAAECGARQSLTQKFLTLKRFSNEHKTPPLVRRTTTPRLSSASAGAAAPSIPSRLNRSKIPKAYFESDASLLPRNKTKTRNLNNNWL